MSLVTLPATEVIRQLESFNTLIDARSESEFALDHVPGAVNWPSLHDEERRIVGTTYKQISSFDARKMGAAMVARNIAGHIDREVLDKPRDWLPLVYCWRGGQRSGALALILNQIGFRVTLIEGGYKAWRAALVQDLIERVGPLRFQVICGPTGSGKTRLLQELARRGAQVLDLEGLAQHRSSVLGLIPGQEQPTQKHFETRLWDVLHRMDPARPIFVENESRKVGNVAVPEALIEAIRRSPCVSLQVPLQERVQLLLQDYAFFVQDAEFFCARLAVLTELRGKATVERWQAHARAGRMSEAVCELLAQHYDPGYEQSMVRNFAGYAQARVLELPDAGPATLQRLAAQLIDETA